MFFARRSLTSLSANQHRSNIAAIADEVALDYLGRGGLSR